MHTDITIGNINLGELSASVVDWGRRILEPEREQVNSSYCEDLLRNIGWISPRGVRPMSVAITGAHVNSGATTTAIATAVAAARTQKERVLLLDANVARPTLHLEFGLDQSPGLSETLLEPELLQSAVQECSVDRLYVLPAGATPQDPKTGRQQFAEFLTQFKLGFSLVVIDASCVSKHNPRLSWLAHADAVLMSMSEDSSTSKARHAKNKLSDLGIGVDGVVLNNRQVN